MGTTHPHHSNLLTLIDQGTFPPEEGAIGSPSQGAGGWGGTRIPSQGAGG